MNRIFEALAIITFVVAVSILTVVAIRESTSAPYTVYATANDGGYLPITYYPCQVREVTPEEVVIDHNGELWACWVSETELKVGDIVWAGFALYEGETQFIGIK